MKKQTKKTLYIAVVVTVDVSVNAITPSARQHGDWSCFTGTDRDKVVQVALEKVRAWGATKYQVLVGTLTDRAVEPARFELVPLEVP